LAYQQEVDTSLLGKQQEFPQIDGEVIPQSNAWHGDGLIKVQLFSVTLKRCSPLLKQRAPTKSSIKGPKLDSIPIAANECF
jgi:hypothetical protein